jgi:hypothetical protein
VVWAAPGGHLGDQGGKQEVARGAQGASTQLLEVGDNVTILQRTPWLLGSFLEVFKQH